MSHVRIETRKVYHAAGRHFLTRHAAYYNAAKRLVSEKYPRELTDEDRLQPGHMMTDVEVARCYDIELSSVAVRRRKRLRLFYAEADCAIECEDCPHAHGYFDPDRWVAFVNRVARFLRYVDRREEQRAGEMLDQLIAVMKAIALARKLDRQLYEWRNAG